jgi:outer membrane protein, adhesin transport system
MSAGFWRDALKGAFIIATLCASANASAMPMREAVELAVATNPEIGEAISNREAIEFELDQGIGLGMPRLDLEARIGGALHDTPTTRGIDKQDEVFLERSIGLVARQLLFDGFATQAEVEHQASRVDAASLRVLERSELIALAVIREYLDLLRLHRIVAVTRENVTYHDQLVGRIVEGVQLGTLSIADRQQAEERLFAARSRVVEAVEEVKAADARFNRLVGQPSVNLSQPPSISGALPANLERAIRLGHSNNPTVRAAQADVDAAYGLLKGAEARFYPKVTLEARARAGHDLGGLPGRNNELQAGVVLDWNLYSGGINQAHRQEQIRRIDQATMALHRVSREVEEAVRLSWDRREQQRERLTHLRRQRAAVIELVGSYSDQFAIGQRSLVDLLDARNAQVNAEITVETALAAVILAEHRILAAVGTLLPTLGVAPPPQSDPYARARAQVPPPQPPETLYRTPPSGLGPLY